MKNRDVNRMTKALGLRRKIIGVRFLYFKQEYDKLAVEEYGRKTSYCMMVKHAMEDNCFKAKLENFGCRCALEALGLDEEMECVESGQRYYSLNLYESRAVAKDVTKDFKDKTKNIWSSTWSIRAIRRCRCCYIYGQCISINACCSRVYV